MNAHASRAALLLLLVLPGCVMPWHKPKQAQQQTLAPPVLATNPPPPSNPIDLPQPKADANIPPFPKPQVKPPSQPKHSRKSANKATVQAAVPPPSVVQQTAAASEVPAIGTFTSGEPSDARNETQRSINDVERGLNGINRKMSDQEQHTAAQIREFIKQARTALSTGDMDGAHTLATKARVLLTELNP